MVCVSMALISDKLADLITRDKSKDEDDVNNPIDPDLDASTDSDLEDDILAELGLELDEDEDTSGGGKSMGGPGRGRGRSQKSKGLNAAEKVGDFFHVSSRITRIIIIAHSYTSLGTRNNGLCNGEPKATERDASNHHPNLSE